MVRVEWIDASIVGTNTWSDIATTIEHGREMTVRPCVSVGFLVHQDEHCLILIPHLAGWPIKDDDVGSGDMTIPKCAVKQMTVLVSA